MRRFIYCDTCKDETEHEPIREDKGLYRCTECGTVTRYLPEKEVTIKAVISTGGVSRVGRIVLKETDSVEVGDELVVETEEGYRVGEVTAIDLKSGKRTEFAEVGSIATVWLRDVSEVIVKFSLHKGAITTPYKMVTSGNTEFEVGERITIDNLRFRITRMKLINGKLLKRTGEKAKAKEIKRIYAMFERKLR